MMMHGILFVSCLLASLWSVQGGASDQPDVPEAPVIDLGCYAAHDAFGRRIMNACSGLSIPTDDTPTVQRCRVACGLQNYTYSAMNGNNCFCGDELGHGTVTNDECTTPCNGTSGETYTECGSAKFSRVYASAISAESIQIRTTDDTRAAFIGDTLTFTYTKTPETASVTDVMYSYGDGTEWSSYDSKTYTMPGDYVVTVRAIDEATNRFIYDSVWVPIRVEPSSVSLTCVDTPVAVNDQVVCQASVDQGSEMQITVNLGEGEAAGEPYNIADPWRYAIGPPISNGRLSGTSGTSGHVLLVSEEVVMVAGAVQQIEYMARATGSVTFVLVSAGCSDTSQSYCYHADQCHSDCAQPLSCSSSSTFCSVSQTCEVTSSSSCSYPDNYPGVYVRWQSSSVTISEVGRHTASPSGMEVRPGDRLGYYSPDGSILDQVEYQDKSSTQITSSSSFNFDNTIPHSEATHSTSTTAAALRAILTRPALVHISHAYTQHGTYQVQVTTHGDFHPDSGLDTGTSQQSATVVVQEPIEGAVIQEEYVAEVGVALEMGVELTAGAPVSYEWRINDVVEASADGATYSKSFDARGVYDVTVMTYNDVSSITFNITVYAEYAVEGLAFSQNEYTCEVNEPCLFGFTAEKGSDLTCNISSSEEDTDVSLSVDNLTSDTPQTYTHTYTEVSSDKLLSIICYNHHTQRGTDGARVYVEQAITGLSLSFNGDSPDDTTDEILLVGAELIMTPAVTAGHPISLMWTLPTEADVDSPLIQEYTTVQTGPLPAVPVHFSDAGEFNIRLQASNRLTPLVAIDSDDVIQSVSRAVHVYRILPDAFVIDCTDYVEIPVVETEEGSDVTVPEVTCTLRYTGAVDTEVIASQLAQVTWDFNDVGDNGDDIIEQEHNFFTSQSVDAQFTYRTTGTYHVSVNVTNPVSEQRYTATIGVYRLITEVTGHIQCGAVTIPIIQQDPQQQQQEEQQQQQQQQPGDEGGQDEQGDGSQTTAATPGDGGEEQQEQQQQQQEEAGPQCAGDDEITVHLDADGGVSGYYVVMRDSSGREVSRDFYTSTPFPITTSREGEYTVEITVANPLNNVTTTTTLTSINRLTTLEIYDQDRPVDIALGGTKTIRIDAQQVGTYSCVHVSWGDTPGTVYSYGMEERCSTPDTVHQPQQGVFSSFTLSHRYVDSSDQVTLTVSAYDYDRPSSVLTSDLSFRVLSDQCNNPLVSIPQAVTDPTAIDIMAVHYTDKMINIPADVALNCPDGGLNNIREWVVELLLEDVEEGEDTIMTVNLTVLPNVHKSPLSLPAGFLQGYPNQGAGVYRATYTVTMDLPDSDTVYSGSDQTYFMVELPKIVPSLIQSVATYIVRSYGEFLDLNPAMYSHDPASEVNNGFGNHGGSRRKRRSTDSSEPMFDNFEWWCQQLNDNSRAAITNLMSDDVADINEEALIALMEQNGGPSCMMDQSGYIEGFNDGHIVIDTATLGINQVYAYMVKVYKGDRSSVAVLQVEITQTRQPQALIVCTNTATCQPTATSLRINPTSDIYLEGDCVSECGTSTSVAYQWSFYTQTQIDRSTPGEWMEYGEFQELATGTTSYRLGIPKSFFDKSDVISATKMKVRLNVAVLDRADASAGMAEVQIARNTPPSGGYCTIRNQRSPTEMTSFLNDLHNLNCVDWVDSDGIQVYQFYVTTRDDDVPRQIGYSNDGKLLDASLPLGPEYDDYREVVWAEIYDRAAASVVVRIADVRVVPLPAAATEQEVENMFNDMENNVIAQAVAIADTRGSCQLLQQALNMINSQNQFLAGEYGNVHGTSTNYGPTAASHKAHKNNSDDALRAYEEGRAKNAQLRTQALNAMETLSVASNSDVQLLSSVASTAVEHVEEVDREAQAAAARIVSTAVDFIKQSTTSITPADIESIIKPTLSCGGSVREAANLGINSPTTYEVDYTVPDYETNLDSTRIRAQDLPDDEQEYAVKKETNSFVQRTAASENNLVMTSSEEGMISAILQISTLGQMTRLETPSMTAVVYTDTVGNLTGVEFTVGQSTYIIHELCPLVMNMDCDDDLVIVLAIITTTSNTYAFSSNGGAVGNAPTTSMRMFRSDDDEELVVGESIDRLLLDDNPYNDDPDDLAVNPNELPKSIEIITTPDPNAVYDDPEPVTLEDLNDGDAPMHYVNFDVTQPKQGCFVEIVPQVKAGDEAFPDTKFLVMAAIDETPNITAGPWDTEFIAIVEPETECVQDGKLKFLFVMPESVIRDQTGTLTVGIRQLDSNDLEQIDPDDLSTAQYLNKDTPANFTHPLLINTYCAACVFFDTQRNMYSSRGMQTQRCTSRSGFRCNSNHLTSFAGGLAVAPNKIDFSYVLANLSFMDNPTLYITEMVIAVIYVVACIWARRQDKKDTIKLGITPLSDNHSNDKYLYEIMVHTGMRKNAGTKSKVHFILSGEYDETDVRVLDDNQRPILRRGAVDSFLMAVPRCLGPLSFARVWHDNSGKGKMQSWYCNMIEVRDLHTRNKYRFLCERWFAVEEDDGMIDRLLPVSGREDLAQFGHQFSTRTRKDMSDGHLWFSVFGRPAASRFTRLQRVSCCLCLLFTSMLANAMFYGIAQSSSNAVNIGPFAMSPEQISVGVMSNLIVFPVNLIIILLFKKSRPRKKRSSRIKDAIEENEKLQKKQLSVSSPPEQDEYTGDQWLLDASRLDEASSSSRAPSTRPVSRSATVTPVCAQGAAKKKKKPFSFPWWGIIIAWIILWLAVIVSAVFVTFYGVQFGDEKCKKWISSMMISFITSILFTQPIKVLLLAVFFALVFKNSNKEEEEEDSEDDEETYEVKHDEVLLHDVSDNNYPARPRKIPYQPPDPVALEEARQLRMKEIQMFDVIREIIFYALFVWVLVTVSYSFRPPLAYDVKNTLQQVFVNEGASTPANFMTMSSIANFWYWVHNTAKPALRAQNWYNGDIPVGQRGFLWDRTSRIMGYAVFRQLRIEPPDTCKTPEPMDEYLDECNSAYSMLKEDKRAYGVGWTNDSLAGVKCDLKPDEYCYKTWRELDGYPYYAKHAVYQGGGYVAEMTGTVQDIDEKLTRLEKEGWVDRYTRAVFLEFTVYNAFVNLFGIVTLVAEKLPTGGFDNSYRVEAVNLLTFFSGAMLFQIACQILFVIFIIVFIVKEVRKLIKEKKAYVKEFWNWVELLVIALSITAIVMFITRMIIANQLTEKFKESHGNAYIKFQFMAGWNETLTYIIGWLCFLATLKFMKLLRFNKRMDMLGSTLRASGKNISMFLIMFGIVMFAFVCTFYQIFSTRLMSFSNFILSAESLLQIMLGDFNFYELHDAERILGPILFIVFVCATSFLLLNMFVSILDDTYAVVRDDASKRTNDYEIVDFMIAKFKNIFGLGKPPGAKQPGQPGSGANPEGEDGIGDGLDTPRSYHPVDQLPPRLDQFFERLGRMYFEQNPFNKRTLEKMAKHNGKPAILQSRQFHDQGGVYQPPSAVGSLAAPSGEGEGPSRPASRAGPKRPKSRNGPANDPLRMDMADV